MAFFIVRMSHPDERGWSTHIDAHMDYLHELARDGTVRASGKVVDAAVKTGCIIFSAADRASLDAIIAADPFSKAGIVKDLKIFEWDPFVGVFASEATGQAPGSGPKAT